MRLVFLAVLGWASVGNREDKALERFKGGITGLISAGSGMVLRLIMDAAC